MRKLFHYQYNGLRMKIIYWTLYLLLSIFIICNLSFDILYAAYNTDLQIVSNAHQRLKKQQKKLIFKIPAQTKKNIKAPDETTLRFLQNYTVQVVQSSNFNFISLAYKELGKRLTNYQKKYLRIVKIGNTYILKIGKFNSLEFAVLLAKKIHLFFPTASVQKTYIKKEHILKILMGSNESPIKKQSNSEQVIFKASNKNSIHRFKKLSDDPQTFSILQRFEKLPTLNIVNTDKKQIKKTDKKNIVKPFYGGDRQIRLIKARIYSRKGQNDLAIETYKKLRKDYPLDQEIWEDYAEVFFYNFDYEAAYAQTTMLLKINPDNLRGQRIQAAVLSAMGQYKKTYQIYEKLLSRFGEDVGILGDYADTRLNAGDWINALNYYCRVLEVDPENKNALRSVHAIEREHRPQLTTSYNLYKRANNTQTDTIYMHYQQQLFNNTKLELDYFNVDVTRADNQTLGLTQIDETLNDFSLTIYQKLNNDLTAKVGAGIYSGLQNRNSFLLGISQKLFNNANIGISYVDTKPWYDPVEAASLNGFSDQFKIDLSCTIDQTWWLYLAVIRDNYMVGDNIDYGTKQSYTGIITKRLLDDPGLSVSYSMYNSKFTYEDEFFQPVSMLEKEMIHSLSFTFDHRFCKYWYYSLSAGINSDFDRTVSSWFISPRLSIRLGNRMELSFGYNYISEVESTDGGVSETFNISSRVIF